MPMPAVVTKANTSGTVVWFPDWMQPDFVIGIQLAITSATAGVDATWDDPNATTTPNWSPIVALGSAALQTARYSTPCFALRLNMSSTGNATAAAVATFIQATFGR
jgi:hypothetical protein